MAAPSLRVVEAGARVYRRTFRGSIVSAFLNPVLYLMAMGIGLGRLVDSSTSGPSLGLPYLTFLAPGLLAATAMQIGAGDAAYPVMAGLKWRKTYQAVLATPITVRDVILGHLGWVTIRLTMVTVIFASFMVAFGATTPLQGAMAVPPATLTGLTFAALVAGYTARIKNESGLAALFRFAIVPMFLFSGTFFPVDQLPSAIRPIAYATPLWHGVSLCRGFALEEVPFAVNPLVSVGYLLALVVVGGWFSIRMFRRRLIL
jgi:lipooligosaccharide transport system permease protein